MAKVILADIETDGLWPSKIHFIWLKELGGELQYFDNMGKFKEYAKTKKDHHWVFHNGLGYDVWHINRLVESNLISPMKIIDTMVVSKLIDYQKFNTHSLKELGQYLGVYKDDYNGDWSVPTKEMIEYGKQDVVVLEAIWNHFKKYIMDPTWKDAMRVEHDTAIICWDMSQNGFKFKKDLAQTYLEVITAEMSQLESKFQDAFPPKLVESTRLKYRVKKDGSLYSSVENAMAKYPCTAVEGDELICYDYEVFNPGSSKQRIDVLWEAKWKPTEMTKGYKKFLRENKQ